MTFPVRRIVTHTDEEGLSYALINGLVDNIEEGLTALWTTGAAPHDHRTSADAARGPKSLVPLANGTLFRFCQIPPEWRSAHLTMEERQQASREFFRKLNAPDVQPDTHLDPGMHLTDTTDYIILLSGNLSLILDKEEVVLKQFDVVVQRGTNHSWVNRGMEDALIVAVLIDAKGDVPDREISHR